MIVWFRRTTGPHHSRPRAGNSPRRAWFRSAGSRSGAPFSLHKKMVPLHKKMAPGFEAEFFTPLRDKFLLARSERSITDAACPEDHATARCFDALSHDAASALPYA